MPTPGHRPPPSYRMRNNQGLVTLTDAETGKRRDYWLGEHDSPASRERYHRVVAEWEARGRRLPPRDFDAPPGRQTSNTTPIAVVVREYRAWAESYYSTSHFVSLDVALRFIEDHYGSTPATDFGPRRLRMLRDAMVRNGWSRTTINQRVGQLRRMFKWAAGQELIPADVHVALAAVESLRLGRTEAPEGRKVVPVPQHILDAVRPHLTKPVRALVELQLLTGARPGELLELRPCDLDMTGDVWTYRPERHKGAHAGRDRVILFGPHAQNILRPFLTDRPTSAYLFSPAESADERREARRLARTTPLSCGNRAGTNRVSTPRRTPRQRYTTPSYFRSIRYACERAFPLPDHLARRRGESAAAWRARLEEQQLWDQARAWRREHRFHPNQLRHNAATGLRRKFGLEAAQLMLGHASAQITDAVYAERDHERIVEIVKRIG